MTKLKVVNRKKDVPVEKRSRQINRRLTREQQRSCHALESAQKAEQGGWGPWEELGVGCLNSRACCAPMDVFWQELSYRDGGITIHHFWDPKGPETVMASISKDEYKDTECSQEGMLACRAREHRVCCSCLTPATD